MWEYQAAAEKSHVLLDNLNNKKIVLGEIKKKCGRVCGGGGGCGVSRNC